MAVCWNGSKGKGYVLAGSSERGTSFSGLGVPSGQAEYDRMDLS